RRLPPPLESARDKSIGHVGSSGSLVDPLLAAHAASLVPVSLPVAHGLPYIAPIPARGGEDAATLSKATGIPTINSNYHGRRPRTPPQAGRTGACSGRA